MPATLPAPPTLPAGLAGQALSLFLDFDGTLVEIAERPDAVMVGGHVRRLVAAVARRLDGRLAVVSGRSADEIATYLHAADGMPPFAIAGSHGLELRWPDGRREEPPRHPALAGALAAFHALAAEYPGVLVEEKPFGAALHYRQAPEAGPACDALVDLFARREGLSIQLGKMVCELRVSGPDKGDAVRRFLAEPPMAGMPPLFLGDDLTDEAGFAVAEEMGGAGVLVGPARPTAARYGLAGVAAVHRWLGQLAGLDRGQDP